MIQVHNTEPTAGSCDRSDCFLANFCAASVGACTIWMDSAHYEDSGYSLQHQFLQKGQVRKNRRERCIGNLIKAAQLK